MAKMKKVLIVGASGNIAGIVIDLLQKESNIQLILFLRSARRLKTRADPKWHVFEGDALKLGDLKKAMVGIDIVYANLAGDLDGMATNIVNAMDDAGVKRLVFISSIGIYDDPVRPVLRPYRKAADVIEASDLDYTILRPTWFTTVDEVDYEITRKGEPEKGSVVSMKSLATFITTLIKSPEKHVRENLGVNKPGS
jgi:uncharacterized protein YbjT (DUF2867 family)